VLFYVLFIFVLFYVLFVLCRSVYFVTEQENLQPFFQWQRFYLCLIDISKPTARIHINIICDCFVFLSRNHVKGMQNNWYLLLLKLYKINVDKTKLLN
jgi:hypothetical protein